MGESFSMLEIIITRHGETHSNTEGRYLGWTDVDLNENGIKQACTLKEKLKDTKIDYIYASPLKRAARTAEIINEAHNVGIIYSESIMERNFGVFDNMTYSEICKNYPVQQELWAKDWVNYCIESGESALQFHNRVCGFVKGLTAEYKKGCILVVAHLGCVRSIVTCLLGLELEYSWRFKVDNCSISKFQIIDNYPVLTLFNGI
jgi:alpha-ribazole phosphatase